MLFFFLRMYEDMHMCFRATAVILTVIINKAAAKIGYER